MIVDLSISEPTDQNENSALVTLAKAHKTENSAVHLSPCIMEKILKADFIFIVEICHITQEIFFMY